MALSCNKKTISIIKRITSKHLGDFYYLNYIRSFAIEKKLESYKKVCENKDFCKVIMFSEDTKILQFDQYNKSDKEPFIIYTDLGCIIEKIDGCKNSP